MKQENERQGAPVEEFVIDLRRHQPYEAGALLLTVLAFPEEVTDGRRFVELHSALCGAALAARARSDPAWANALRPIKPAHLSPTEKQRAAALRTFDRRLRDRMVAGRIANAIIFNAAGLNPKLPKGCEDFSIKQLIKLALDDVGQEEAENAEQRIWRASLPVIHLAAALQAYLNRKDKAAYEVSYGDIIFDEGSLLLQIAQRAKETFDLMKNHSDHFRLGRKPPLKIRVV